jgi:hypothetical protein
VAAAAFLFAVFSSAGKRCSVRVVPYYTKNELDALTHEEYPSFIFLDCVEADYHKKFEEAVFLSPDYAYHAACASFLLAPSYAHILSLGYIAAFLEHSDVTIPDDVLRDTLRSALVLVTTDYTEVTPEFLMNVAVRRGEISEKLIDGAGVLYACCRSGKATLALAALFDNSLRTAAFAVWADYRREIDRALHWCTEKEDHIRRGRGVLIIHAQDFVASYLTGSVAAHISQQKTTEHGSLVLVLTYTPDGRIRVSLRSAGKKQGLSLVRLLGNIFEGIDGEYGGTEHAAGGVFIRSQEETFLSKAQVVLEHAFAEENV